MRKYINPPRKRGRCAPIRDTDIKSEGVIERTLDGRLLWSETTSSVFFGAAD
jgi:hypothetical protein